MSSHVVEAGEMTQKMNRDLIPQTTGRTIHWAFAYDLLVPVIWLGREGAFRRG